MAWHCWGDGWEHWNELYKAERYFNKFYEKCTGKYPMTKEKYGTMRFEYIYLWIESEEHCRIFKEGVRRTIKKFPHVAGEVVSDASHVLNDEYFNGWCNGVSYITTGSYWSSDKRPNGV